jgi:predicted RND superfamily exporter protein
VSKDFTQGRIAGRIVDKGSLAVNLKNRQFHKWLERQKPQNLTFRITGSSDLIDKSNQYLTQNMLEGLSLDVVVLMLIIGLLFRSLRMMLISILPNLIPLLVAAGIMGFAQIEMKVTISIIFSIAFGIAIDDTLHLLSRFKLELNKGKTIPMAMRTTFLSTGKAMILTAMVIASGFATLMLSDFKSTYYVGLLISLTLVIALLAELVLMPVLLVFLHKRRK